MSSLRAECSSRAGSRSEGVPPSIGPLERASGEDVGNSTEAKGELAQFVQSFC